MAISIKRDQVWQLRNYQQKTTHFRGNATSIDELLTTWDDLNKCTGMWEQFEASVIAVQILKATHHPIPSARTWELFTKTKATLAKHNIGPRSKLAPLLVDLYAAIGKRLQDTGEIWLGLWYEHLGVAVTGKNGPQVDLFDQRILKPLTPDAADLPDKIRHINKLRNTASLMELEQELENLSNQQCPESLKKEIAWQKTITRFQLTGDPRPGLTHLRRSFTSDVTKIIEHNLWVLVSAQKTNLKHIYRHSVLKSKTRAPELNCLRTLLECYHSKRPLWERLEELGNAFNQAATIEDSKIRMLTYVAAARWLHRVRQPDYARLCQSVYQAYSLRISRTLTTDVYGIDFSPESIDTSKNNVLPIRPWQRTAAICGLTGHLVRYVGWSAVRRLFAPAKTRKKVKQEEIDQLLQAVLTYLGRFKGPLLKVGQILSNYKPGGLQSLTTDLERFPEQSQSITFPEVKAILEQAYGCPLGEIFTHFELKPSGIGSIGQVHIACLPSGEQVAVKVRYPNIKDAIAFDMKILKLLTPIVNYIAPTVAYSAIVKEVGTSLMNETNFVAEAERQQNFGAHCAWIPNLCVPKIHRHLCHDNILVSEFIDGQDYHTFVKNGPQAERDAAALAIGRYIVFGCVTGFFNTDPNPGNFIFKDGQVYALDFGNVKRWPLNHTRHWRTLIQSCFEKDVEAFQQVAIDMGLVKNLNLFDPEKTFSRLILNGTMGQVSRPDFRTLTLAQVHRDIRTSLIARAELKHVFQDFPPEFILAFRTYYGGLALVAQIPHNVDWRGFLSELLYDDPAGLGLEGSDENGSVKSVKASSLNSSEHS